MKRLLVLVEAKPFSLRESDRDAVANSKAGKPTFAPRSGNRLLCNQLPHLGPLSPKQARLIRTFCAPRGSKEVSPITLVKAKPRKIEVLEVVERDIDNDVLCPGCGAWIIEMNLGIQTCPQCEERFNVVPYVPMRQATNNSSSWINPYFWTPGD